MVAVAEAIRPDATDLLSENPLPSYEIGIDERVKAVGEHALNGFGAFRDDLFIMSDGSRYDVRIFQPNEPKYETAVTMTTPLGTDLGGLNTTVGKEAARAGMTTVLVGPDRESFWGSLNRFGRVILNHNEDGRTTLSHDAFAHHVILNELDKEGLAEKNESILVGYSRGAMEGFGVLAYSSQFGRNVIYSDLVDPCLEHAIKLGNMRLKKIALYLYGEVVEFSKGLEASNANELKHLPKTLPNSFSKFIQQISIGVGLFRGEVGPLARHVPKDSLMNVTAYRGSMFNQHEFWQEIFSRDKFPRVHLGVIEGKHISGIKPIVRLSSMGKVIKLQEMVADGIKPAGIKPEELLASD